MPISSEEMSRIDKLFMDRDAKSLDESHSRRAQHGLHVRAGEDIKTSYGLQLALLTAINLGVKCFAGEAMAHGSAELWLAPCLVPAVRSATLGDAVIELGGKLSMDNGLQPQGRCLMIGNAENDRNAIRVTYDGWRVEVGPANEVSRMAERPYCPLASIAAAAIAVGEVFAEFAGISISATRRVVMLSLWRPDLPSNHPDGIGEQIIELPLDLGIFGLGHLGQAYLWGIAALPFSCRDKATILLCDDDVVEKANVETGALLTPADVTQQKTRAAMKSLEACGFSTRLLERRVDENYRRAANEPAIALCGFDNNLARQWLSQAGYTTIFESGLGGEEHNFDIRAVDETEASFDSMIGLMSWLASDKVQSLSAKPLWPTPESHQLWLDFIGPTASQAVKQWTAAAYHGPVTWHSVPMPPGMPLRLGGGLGKERSVFAADYKEVGTLTWTPNPKVAGVIVATSSGAPDNLDFEYIGPGDLLTR